MDHLQLNLHLGRSETIIRRHHNGLKSLSSSVTVYSRHFMTYLSVSRLYYVHVYLLISKLFILGTRLPALLLT